MTSDLPEKLQISKTILERLGDSASIAGHNGLDDQGRLVVQLGVRDDAGRRDLQLAVGDTFEFAGAVWKVAKVFEPSTATRGSVATLTKVT